MAWFFAQAALVKPLECNSRFVRCGSNVRPVSVIRGTPGSNETSVPAESWAVALLARPNDQPANIVGFLMNHQAEEGLIERIHAAEPAVLRPLEMVAQTESGATVGSLAYNEVSLLRQTRQAAHLSIELNGKPRLDELICDGVMVATPAGSSAYNFSAHGPILPLGANVMALTPIAAFRPRRWRGAVLKADTEVRFRVLDPYKRPVSATADSHEVRDVVEVMIRESRDRTVTLLFDPEHNLEERMLAEQFISG